MHGKIQNISKKLYYTIPTAITDAAIINLYEITNGINNYFAKFAINIQSFIHFF